MTTSSATAASDPGTTSDTIFAGGDSTTADGSVEVRASSPLILAPDRSQVMAVISHRRFDRPIQPLVMNHQELATMKQEEPAFYAQVQRGIVLWEAMDELAS